MKNKRIMAIDYGEVRIGVALSDPSHIIASPLETYKRREEQKDLEYLTSLIKINEVGTLIFGLPLNMDGSEGRFAEKTRIFANKISEFTGINVEFVDERLTSIEAEELLISAGVRRDKRKEMIDKVAATLILEGYLRKK